MPLLFFAVNLHWGAKVYINSTLKVKFFKVCILSFITIPVCTHDILRTSLEFVCVIVLGDRHQDSV